MPCQRSGDRDRDLGIGVGVAAESGIGCGLHTISRSPDHNGNR